jgi:hypothetical protein
MRRRLLVAFVPTIAAAVLAAAPAAGKVPGGQGLVLELDVTLLAIIRLREPAPALAPLPSWRPAATSGSPG